MYKKLLLILLLSTIPLKGYVSLSHNLINATEKKDTLNVQAEKYIKESEKIFKDYYKSTTEKEVIQKQSLMKKFTEGLKILTLPLQKAIIKMALWKAKKICETTDDLEGAGFATIPQFAIIETLKGTATPELIKSFMDKSNDPEFRYLCIDMYSTPKDTMVVESLIKVMMDSTDKLRGGACTALGSIKDKRAVEPMIELYKKGEMRRDVIWSLGVIGDKRAYDVVMDGLKHGDPKLKWSCISAFGRLGDKRAVPILVEMLESKEDIIIEHHGSVKPAIIIALGEIGDERAVPALKKMLKHNDWYYRAKASDALGEIRDKKALDALIPLAEKGELDAIKAIGKIGGKRATEELERLKIKLKSIPDPYFHKCLDKALKEAKSKK
mgnify:CR=1 FL=1